MIKTIEVVPYDPQWPKIFEDEARLIRYALNDACLHIYHVGSTAVPGLDAKPVIDMILVARDFDFVIKSLETLSYPFKGELNIPCRRFFSKKVDGKDFHIHAYEQGHPEVALNLMFRDYLRSHPCIRDSYAALKRELVSQEKMHIKSNAAFTGYTLGKYGFIQDVLKRAGFDQLCMRFCAHPLEWAAYHRICGTQISENFSDTSPLTDPNHRHLVLYKGTVIVGVAHIELIGASTTVLRLLTINTESQNQGYDAKFLQIIEKWLKLHGKTILHP